MTTPAAHSIAHTDQLAAAARDARQALEGAAASGRGHLVPVVAGTWLAEQAAALHDWLTNGPVRCCPHLHNRPRIIHAAVWAPRLLVCTDCAPLLIPDPEEDHTCDRCHHTADHLHPGVTVFGPVLLGYGLCHSCAASASTQPASATLTPDQAVSS